MPDGVQVKVELSGPFSKDTFDKRNPVFKLGATYSGASWFVLHPWSDFAALQQHIRAPNGGGSSAAPRFPSGKAGLFKQSDQRFWEKRAEPLGAYMQWLLTDERMKHNPTVREFVHLDQKVAEIESSAAAAADGAPADLDGALADDTQCADAERIDIGPTERVNARPSDFEYLKCIGRGSFGKVYMAVHRRESRVYAVKVLAKAHIKKRNEVRHIMSERNVLVVNIKHPFLVGLHYSFQTRDKLYFVLEYVNGGELFFHLQREKRFAEARARFYAAEIASALGYLHSKDIIYRDLKPENLLIDAAGHVCITDFGLCKENVRGRQTTSTFCGTPEYLAPEVVLKQPYDRTVDWWCLGSVLFEMLFGLPPFYSKDHKEMYDRIVNQPLRVPAVASPTVKDILQQMLQKDRTRRMGAKKDFEEVRSHMFFAAIDWGLLNQRKLTPPYIPKVADEKDVSFVDKEFLREAIPESVGQKFQELSASVRASNHEFTGFTYVPRTALDEITE